ncbi:MAG TPA: CBS domain-containing protein [Isosphaeraceae bacterium]|jgi:CBS domain-containing protein|nr:CBS domain-containing protein [Isosphaeraceae bacterium]
MPAQNETVAASAEQLSSTLTAADIMTRNPRTCSTFSSVLEAVLIFRDADCGAVPVIQDGTPAGVLTDRDVALALAEHPDVVSLPVSQIMSSNVVSVLPNASFDAILEKFGEHRLRRLLVIDSTGQIQGIIAWADLAPHISDRGIGQVVSETVQPPRA